MLENEDRGERPIAPGMDVCDVSGEKVGTVSRLHHPTGAQDVIEVKTGLFGLGQHLYVPSDEVDAVTEAGVILKHAKQQFHEVGLDAPPEGVSD
jgi:ribosomal 30S subunit maturation factor RimM